MGRGLTLVESSRTSLSIIVVVRREGGFHRLATGGYGRQVATGDGGDGDKCRLVLISFHLCREAIRRIRGRRV
jgi:hypothetical protein